MSSQGARSCLKMFITMTIVSFALSATAYTQSAVNLPDIVARLTDLSSLVEHSGAILVGVEGWPINGNFTMAIDKTMGQIIIKSGYSPGETTSYQFLAANLGSIELKAGSGEHQIFQQDANGVTTSTDAKETQTANINFNMKNHLAYVQVAIDSTGRSTRRGTGTGVQVMAISCTKEQVLQMQTAIDEINRLLGAKLAPPNQK